MKSCPQCGYTNISNTLFCDACGAPLRDDIVVEPTRLYEETVNGGAVGDFQYRAPPSERTTLVTGQWALVILPQRHIVRLPEIPSIILGRGHHHKDPFIDLEPYGAHVAGVSRRHARLTRKGMGVYIEDLSSTNGTYVNRVRIPAHTPTPVQPGDIIKLGRMKILIQAE